MLNYWKLPGIPQKGWEFVIIIDLREEGKDYETCMMCGMQQIRYVHVLCHSDVTEEFRVGCDCAERMLNDYLQPRKRQLELENRAKRKMNWLNKAWKQSIHGNYFYNYKDHFLLIFKDKKTGMYKFKIDDHFFGYEFKYLQEAKAGIFNQLDQLNL